jgi:hypothetical protein
VSNSSTLERLEESLSAYANGTLTRDAFVDFLSNSIRALEGVPLSVAHELRRHEYAIETEGYLDDEGFEHRQGLVRERLRSWIHDLKRIYCK